MTEREISGDPTEVSVIDRLAAMGADSPSSRGGGIAVDDIRDYLGRALRSGFPEAASLGPEVARRLWLESYVTQITTRDVTGATGLRDPALLRRYLEAYALNSAGIVDAKTLYEAAGISKMTAARYERILENVFVTQSIPAWTSNRLKRLALSPKRYITDPGLLAAILLLDEDAILRDASLLGRIIDTFVTAQLRAEATVARSRPRMFHLRQRDGGHEVDLVLELGGGRLIGIEVKAASTIHGHDARHLAWLRDQSGERFIVGIVLHTGPHAFPLGDRITALPINALW
jgi:predicted AAA+ superfamily ATPase